MTVATEEEIEALRYLKSTLPFKNSDDSDVSCVSDTAPKTPVSSPAPRGK